MSFEVGCALGPVVVDAERGKLMVIQTGTHEPFVFEGKPQRLHEVQSCPSIGAESNNIAGVGRNLGLIKDDMEHEDQKGPTPFSGLAPIVLKVME